MIVNNALFVEGASIRMPSRCRWHANVDVLTQDDITGPVTLTMSTGLTLTGVMVGRVVRGVYRGLVVGGAGKLSTVVGPQTYEGSVARHVLLDVVQGPGETLSSTIDAAILTAALTRYVLFQAPAAVALEGLLTTLGVPTWRVLPDGTLWIGTDTYPAAPDPALSPAPEFTILDEDGAHRRMTLAVEDPWLLPATTFQSRIVDRVVHTLSGDQARTEVFFR